MSPKARAGVVVSAIALVSICAAGVPGQLRAQASRQTVRLSPQDTTLNLDTNNYSADTRLRTYTWPDNRVANAIVLAFDLSGIPAGAVVEDATLRLALVESDPAADASYRITAHKLLGKKPQLDRATGYTTDGVTPWTPSACCHNGVPLAQGDISLAYDAQAIDKTAGLKAWTVTTIVQEWLAEPAANYGLVLNSDAGALKDRYRFFASVEDPDPGLRPYLEVTYTIASGDVTPPAVAVTSPAPGARVSGPVGIGASAEDSSGISGVQFHVDGVPVGNDSTPPYTADWDSASVSDGPHTFTATATDGAGNVASATADATVANGVLRLMPQDTTINLNTKNYSRDAQLSTYTWPNYQPANAILMNFDLSALPSGAGVIEATLYVALIDSDTASDSTYSVGAHRIVGRTLAIERATGFTSDGVSPWTPSSCCHRNIPLAQADISAPYFTRVVDKARGFKTWTITSLVRDWLENPEEGPALLLNSDVTKPRDRYRRFASVEHADPRLRPYLVIKYSADSAPPSVTLVSPPANATISGPVTVEASAFDDVGVAGVRFDLNGTPIAPELTQPPYSLSWDPASTPDGSYTLSAVARDDAGNIGTASRPVNVAKDTAPPAVSITSPAPGAHLSGAITVSASASDDVGVTAVQLTLDGANLGAELTAPPFTLSWDTTKTGDGAHTLAAVARDAAGRSTTSTAIDVLVANGRTYTTSFAPQDTSLNINSTNYSADALLTTYTWPDNRVANAILMTFNLLTLPPDAVVQQAELRLSLVASDATADASYAVAAHKLVGRNPIIAAATGYTADGVNGWTPNACCHNDVPLAQADISTAYDTRAIDKTPGTKTWTLTKMVSEWIANPASNFGVLLNSDTGALRDRYRNFASAEHSDPALRPTLQVTYTSATGPIVVPPVVSIDAPAPGATVSGTVTVRASATASGGVAGVQFRLDGAALGAEDISAPYEAAWNTTGAINGSHVLTAIARDTEGRVTTSSAVTVTVSNVASPPGAPEAFCPGGTNPDPNVVWCDNFEGGDYLSRYDIGTGPGRWPASDLVKCGGFGFGDDCAAWSNLLSFDSAWGYYGYDAVDYFPGQSEFYVRFYQYISNPFTWGSLEDKSVMIGDRERTLFTYVATDRTGGGCDGTRGGLGMPAFVNYQDRDWPELGGVCTKVNRFQNMGNDITLQPGKWYLFEVYIKLNTPGATNGVVKLWIDDASAPITSQTLRLYYTDMRFLRSSDAGKLLNEMRLTVYHQRCDSGCPSQLNQSHKWDNIVIRQTPIGPMVP